MSESSHSVPPGTPPDGRDALVSVRRTTPVAIRLWVKIDRSDPGACWVWTGRTSPKGCRYRYISIDGRKVGAHRVAWELVNGAIPKGMHVCHRCDNPPCCNPAHLFLGTNTDNMRDCALKGRNWAQSATGKRCGAANPNATLSAREVAEVRDLRTAMTSREVARTYGVSQSVIKRINQGVTYR